MVSIELTINLNGFSDDEIKQGMFILGELVINKIKQNIRDMKLISDGGGQLLQGWFAKFDGNQLLIENTQDYMMYLEFGTYAYYDMYGTDSHPKTPDPKKKDMPYAMRKLFPKGMQPFAFQRKVLYNELIMEDLARQAFS